ncbi:MAG: hypothetical protein ACPH3H_00220, partial [Pseudomonadales bacterium]
MKFLSTLLVTLLTLFQPNCALSAGAHSERLKLEQGILTARLEGNYDRALAQTERLKLLPDSRDLAIALELDTRLTRLSWDSQSHEEDGYLFGLSEQLIALCPKN